MIRTKDIAAAYRLKEKLREMIEERRKYVEYITYTKNYDRKEKNEDGV